LKKVLSVIGYWLLPDSSFQRCYSCSGAIVVKQQKTMYTQRMLKLKGLNRINLIKTNEESDSLMM